MSYGGNEVTDLSFLNSIEAWQKDQSERFDIERLTESFHQSVPVLKFLDWHIKSVARGEAETVLPLNIASTNQYITHQAALMLLAADYTGGIALSSLLQMVPIIGFHSMKTDYGAYMWGAKAGIKWLRPSCEDLVCRAEIPEADRERIARRFFEGKRVIETIKVNMYNGDVLVAEADFSYWAQDSHSLREHAFDKERVHVLFDHKFKTSARLIAGLRALEQNKDPKQRLFNDPHAFTAAQNHGVTIARRFCESMPQLQSMVAARTKHLDELLSSLGEDWIIVNIGTGLDTRPWRLPLKHPTIYELDLPLMLDVRDKQLPDTDTVNADIRRIPIDLRYQDIYQEVSRQPNFDAGKPVLVIWEGGSMYFDELDARKILSSAGKLLTHAESRIWFDFVAQDVIDNTTGIDSVASFIASMRRMGEPFINGYSDIRGALKQSGLVPKVVDRSDKYFDTRDPIYSYYHFCVAATSAG